MAGARAQQQHHGLVSRQLVSAAAGHMQSGRVCEQYCSVAHVLLRGCMHACASSPV